MDFIIDFFTNMFSNGFTNYCICSYSLIIPSIILFAILNHFICEDSLGLNADEVGGMILLAPLGILFVWLGIILILGGVIVCFIGAILSVVFEHLLGQIDYVIKKINQYREDFGC